MKKISLMALLAISCNSFAMEITPNEHQYTFPNAAVLRTRFAKIGFNKEVIEQGLIRSFAGQEKTIKEALYSFDGIISFYTKYLEEQEIKGLSSKKDITAFNTAAASNRQKTLEALFQGYPEALEELKATLQQKTPKQ